MIYCSGVVKIFQGIVITGGGEWKLQPSSSIAGRFLKFNSNNSSFF